MNLLAAGAAMMTTGLRKSNDDHHSIPKFLGGHDAQDMVGLSPDAHREFHSDLRGKLKGYGLTPGGHGSKKDWMDFFKKNKAAQIKAFSAVLEISQKFDAKHGKGVTESFIKNLTGGKYDWY